MAIAIAAKPKWTWALAFLCAGVGCGLLGPLLPMLARQWALADDRSGLLLGLVLAGSCCGTLTLERRLERAVRRGAVCAAAGMAALALCTRSHHAYFAALAAVSAAGFGMGSLMSAVNLLAGALPARERTAVLARLGAVWCVGAMLSPVFVAPRFLALPLEMRLLLLAALFLLCLLDRNAWRGAPERPRGGIADAAAPSEWVTLACAAAMFLYGGAEGCLSGWLPTFAARYGGRSLATAPWVTSALWLGLIVARMAVPRTLSCAARERILKIALPAAALLLALLLLAPQRAGIAAGLGIGVLIGPGFPLVFSGTLDWRLGTRRMGIVLAAAALGGAVCPLVVGQVSMVTGLRAALALPVAILVGLPWLPLRSERAVVTTVAREPISV